MRNNEGVVKSIVSIVVVIIGIGWLLYLAVHTEEVMIKVDKVYTVYTVEAIAEYSEIHTGYNIDGDYYSETDYWSEQASDKIQWITENGEPSNVKVDDPPLYKNIDRGYNFDGISWHRDLYYYLIANLKGKDMKFTINESKYKRVLNRTNDVLKVEINGFDIIKKIK